MCISADALAKCSLDSMKLCGENLKFIRKATANNLASVQQMAVASRALLCLNKLNTACFAYGTQNHGQCSWLHSMRPRVLSARVKEYEAWA